MRGYRGSLVTGDGEYAAILVGDLLYIHPRDGFAADETKPTFAIAPASTTIHLETPLMVITVVNPPLTKPLFYKLRGYDILCILHAGSALLMYHFS